MAVALAMREEGQTENDLLDRLAADPRLPIDRAGLAEALADPMSVAGRAPAQVAAFAEQVAAIADRFPDAPPTSPATSSRRLLSNRAVGARVRR